MSQTDSAPLWTGPREFEASLKNLLAAAGRGNVTFDRSWTFRNDDKTPDFMVEVTRLVGDSDTMQTCGKHVPKMNVDEFETKLSTLLHDAYRANVGFDRAWTFRCADGTDLMVEITRLAKLD